jgi:response regulator RpfG family c-di-GMP phosphodiesterase
VSTISREIAQLLDLNEGEATQIEIAALLHDIGKVGLPARLFQYEEDKWSPRDRALFQNHPQEGQATLQFIDNLDHVGLLIRSHHEQYDGHGYPDHLAEEEIPLGARIIAVADAYDNIVNLKIDMKGHHRNVTRQSKASTKDQVLKESAILHLKQHGSTRYDPDIIKVFLHVIKTTRGACVSEEEVLIQDLREGMVLSRPVYSSSNRFLLSHETRLKEDYIVKLKELHKHDPITDAIYVVRNSDENHRQMSSHCEAARG